MERRERKRIQIKEERDFVGRQGKKEKQGMYFEVMSRAQTCLPGVTPGGRAGACNHKEWTIGRKGKDDES